MKLRQRFSNAYRAFKGAKSNPYTSQTWGPGSDPFSEMSYNKNKFKSDSQQLDAYSLLSWVAVAVDCLSRDVGGQEWFFTDQEGVRVETSRVPEEISLPLLNGFRTKSLNTLTKTVVSHRALSGNAYWLKTKNTAFGQVRQVFDSLTPISPDRVKPLLSEHGFLLNGYEIKLMNGERFTVPPEELIHFDQNTIYNPFVGVGNLTKMRLAAEGEVAINQYMNSVLGRTPPPAMVISDSDKLTPKDYERKVSLLKARYGEGIMVVNGDNIKVDIPKVVPSDIDYIEQRQLNRIEILAVFGVPPVVAGIPDGANRAIANTMRLAYLANTVNNMLGELEEAINSQHVNLIDKRFRFRFKRHTTGDVEYVTQMVQNGIISPNRASELLGEEFDENDFSRSQYYLGASFVALGSVSDDATGNDPDNNSDDKGGKALEFDLNKYDPSNPKNVEAIVASHLKSATRPKRFQARYLRQALSTRNRLEDRYAFELKKFFRAQGKRISQKLIENFPDGKSINKKELQENPDEVIRVIYDSEFENSEMVKELERLHTAGVQKSIRDINGLMLANVNLNLNNPAVASAISRLAKRVTGITDGSGGRISMTDTTRAEIRSIIVNGVNDNLTVNEISDNLLAKFNKYEGYRARRIARTESRAAWDAGAEIAYEELGVETVDVVGCTQFENDSDCGKQGIPLHEIPTLKFHPNHIGSILPSKQP